MLLDQKVVEKVNDSQSRSLYWNARLVKPFAV
jgi:hypothetical protein